jgi:large subunit ribosomal protein L19
MDLLATVTKAHLRKEPIGEFAVGDTVDVHCRIKEGDKERVQIFNGTVIAKSRGHGAVNASFVVRRVVAGEGVERTFPVHSPRVAKVEVVRRGRVRRAKLYFLRDRVGKQTRVDELLGERARRLADGVPSDDSAATAPEAPAQG